MHPESLAGRLSRLGISQISVVRRVWDRALCPAGCPHLVIHGGGQGDCQILSGRGLLEDCPRFATEGERMVKEATGRA